MNTSTRSGKRPWARTKLIGQLTIAMAASLLLAACAPTYPPPPQPMVGDIENMMSGGHMGGMMGAGHMGMMGQFAAGPTLAPTPFGATPAPVDEEILITAQDSQFQPVSITITAGEAVRWRLNNRDAFAHNFYSEEASIPYVLLPANATQEIVWQTPTTTGAYTALCTFHPGMSLEIRVVAK